MDFTHRLAVSYYKTIAVINEEHSIYLVQHQQTKKIYVKKILDVYNMDVYEYLYRHPVTGTPRIVDYCEEENQLIIIEDYISGSSLEEKIGNADLTVDAIRSYMLDLCSILESLHSVEPAIIHRDIKPSNIIITSYNRAVLLDFNAAKYYSAGSAKDTVLLGTEGYAAPEQYGFGSSSPQTDIYALGVVLKEMLDVIPDPAEDLQMIADRCTQLNQSERFSDVLEMKKSLVNRSGSDPANNEPDDMRRFLPPGYRTGTPWKMLLATVSYAFIVWLCLTLETNNTTGAGVWIERIFVLVMALVIVCGCFNYLDIQRFAPMCRSKNHLIRYLGIALLVFAVDASLMIILILLETAFFPK